MPNNKKRPELFMDTAYENQEGEEMDPLLTVEDVKRTACPEENLMAKDRAQLIQELMSSLTEEQRMCVMMYYLEEIKVKDIAASLDVSENTVKSRLFQARKALAQKAESMKKNGYVFSVAPFTLLLRLLLSEKAAYTDSTPVIVSSSGASAASAGGVSHAAAAKGVVTAGKAGGVLSTVGGKIAVGILGAIVLGGAAFGGVKAAPYLLERFTGNSQIVMEEAEEEGSETPDHDGETIEETAQETVTADKADDIMEEESSFFFDNNRESSEAAQAVMTVYQAYKEILTDQKESLGFIEEWPEFNLSNEGAIAFYDVWGDNTKEMIFCSCEWNGYSHLPSLYCVTSYDGQVYYLTEDGLLSREGSPASLIRYGYGLENKFCGISVYSPREKNGLYTGCYDNYIITSEDNSSDLSAKIVIDKFTRDIDGGAGPAADVKCYYSQGLSGSREEISEEQFNVFLERYNNNSDILLLSNVEIDKSIGMNYEEAIAYLDGEIVRLNAIVNGTEEAASQKEDTSAKEDSSHGQEGIDLADIAAEYIKILEANKEFIAFPSNYDIYGPRVSGANALDKNIPCISLRDLNGDSLPELIFLSSKNQNDSEYTIERNCYGLVNGQVQEINFPGLGAFMQDETMLGGGMWHKTYRVNQGKVLQIDGYSDLDWSNYYLWVWTDEGKYVQLIEGTKKAGYDSDFTPIYIYSIDANECIEKEFYEAFGIDETKTLGEQFEEVVFGSKNERKTYEKAIEELKTWNGVYVIEDTTSSAALAERKEDSQLTDDSFATPASAENAEKVFHEMTYEEAVTAGLDQAWLQGLAETQPAPKVANTTASSELDETNLGLDHSAAMICDGTLTSAWCEGVSGDGIGEWVKLEFEDGYAISSMEIYAGYHKSNQLYYENSRPKEILIVFEAPDGNTTSETIVLKDVFKAQNISFSKIHYATSVTIYIQSTFNGTLYDDTLITEVVFD